MLRNAQTCLGRWSSRDFLRGRSKRAGAVHTRHTHGRQGRYKRLSAMYSSVRDGRRHAGNHMQGGLGIKLGGGLFGLRIPRQHQLSHMSREEFDLEVYGHPNITNPYREHLDEHPDLKSVMMNASVAMKVVVLLPRVARNGEAANATSTVPQKWRRVVREVSDALELLATPPGNSAAEGAVSSGNMEAPDTSSADSSVACPPVEVHFATLEASVCCQWPMCRAFSSSSSSRDSPPPRASSLSEHWEERVAQLYYAHCKLGPTLRPEKRDASYPRCPQQLLRDSPSSTRRRKHPAAFMGATMRASLGKGVIPPLPSEPLPTCAALSTPSLPFTSFVLAQLTKDVSASASSCLSAVTQCTSHESSAVSTGKGLSDIVHHLSATEQPLLRVCIRPTSTCECNDISTLSAAPLQTGSAPFSTSAPVIPRRVLTSEIDLNAECGVWRLPKSPLRDLLRWHYCSQDPRAHNHDALPHHRRFLPLLVVVDSSTAGAFSPPSARPPLTLPAAAGRGSLRRTTLMPRRLSLELESTGFKMAKEASLRSVAEAIAEWAPSAQWKRFAQASPSCSLMHAEHHHHGAASTPC
ncbi:hypothetical protein ABL78_0498 [Leptomonas seymouri]|uniref:Uncharacterized protein n=1 Tax=Leptomonas seymouri TaxID=5684 RepID=A0A0N1PGI0_LEPSE|nr:hypothetical protein ABL78_0498 [Leptomonas seymouri]|eukprot:KPI90422.1 hypothetical protein ABL78_0498 [Leptomonas seymouri]